MLYGKSSVGKNQGKTGGPPLPKPNKTPEAQRCLSPKMGRKTKVRTMSGLCVYAGTSGESNGEADGALWGRLLQRENAVLMFPVPVYVL